MTLSKSKEEEQSAKSKDLSAKVHLVSGESLHLLQKLAMSDLILPGFHRTETAESGCVQNQCRHSLSQLENHSCHKFRSFPRILATSATYGHPGYLF